MFTMPESQLVRGHDLINEPQSHALFLSHSGKQKPFARNLYHALYQNSFSTFFDIEHHSLPPGEHFPSHIFQAAGSCEVALVLLSEDFVCSKWPMIELCAFVAAIARGVKLMPLFYKLSCADLKAPENLERWRKAWGDHASKLQGGKYPINVLDWEKALQELTSHSGVLFDQESAAEKGYIDKIVSAVSAVVAPAFDLDTTYVAGKDRLCQIIQYKFKQMECEYSSLDYASASVINNLKREVTCLLGLYGLPGSGKSTLCRCLVDHYRRSFGSTKVLHMEFSSSPSDKEVVNKLKELLYLTDFRDTFKLDNISNLESVVSLLKRYRLSIYRVFLVMDNLSTNTTRQAVHRILDLGFGHGSKIILVAHTSEVLKKILPRSHEHWVCDIMAVPTIDETEALKILLRTARYSCNYNIEGLDKNTLSDIITSRHMEIFMRIVRMCSHEGVWSPLIMEAMGAKLLDYEDVEKWASVLDRGLWSRVEAYKQSVLIETLLGDNFKALPTEDHQLIFLDVALFILHFESKLDAVIALLSIMHGISAPRIGMMIRDLQSRGFLTTSVEYISVHDVYLQFAKGIEEYGVSKYLKTTNMINWHWLDCRNVEVEESCNLLRLAEGDEEGQKARALVLQVQGQRCERVDLQGFSDLRAVCLMGCEHVVVLGLAGLSSLRILEIKDCASFRQVECNEEVRSLQRFVVIGKNLASRQPCTLGSLVSLMRNLQILRMQGTRIERLDCDGSMWPQLRELTVVEPHLKRFKLGCLPQLEGFYFDDHVDVGVWKCWSSDDHVGLREYWSLDGPWVVEYQFLEYRKKKETTAEYLLPEKDLLRGCPNLKLVKMETPFVTQAQVSGFLPASLEKLELIRSDIRAIELPDHNSSSSTAQGLIAVQELRVTRCERLEKVKFDTGFEILGTLILEHCHTLEVVGLGSLSRLRVLKVKRCRNLQSLKGLAELEMLEKLSLVDLHELREISCYSSNLMKLNTLKIEDCGSQGGTSNIAEEFLSMPQSNEILGQQLRRCKLGLDGRCRCSHLNLAYLEYFRLITHVPRENGNDYFMLDDLEALKTKMKFKLHVHRLKRLTGRIHDTLLESAEPVASMTSDSDDDDPKRFLTFNLSRLKFNIDQLASGGLSMNLLILPGGSLQKLAFKNGDVLNMAGIDFNMHLGAVLQKCSFYCIDNLRSLRRLESLAMLQNCSFHMLMNLRSLRGVESLAQLRQLLVMRCPLLEEMPSLHALVHMQILYIIWCPKLKAVDGCDSMTQLRTACFAECEIMERLPFRDFRALSNLKEFETNFVGCYKLRSNVEEMVGWVMEKVAPPSLRWESLQAVLELYYQLDVCSMYANDINEKEQMAEAFLSFMARIMIDPSGGDSPVFSWSESEGMHGLPLHEMCGEDNVLLRAAVRELGDTPPHSMHVSSIIRFLDNYEPFHSRFGRAHQ